mgnify:CR=1 FL=1|tara:strand:+ start:61 stop:480 length:420 start_codon:yes stop_codon:yes gene_type:complete
MARKTATFTILRGEFRDGKKVHKVGDTISLSPEDGARHVATGDLAETPADTKSASKAEGPSSKSEDPYGLGKTLEPVEGRDEQVEIPNTDGKTTAFGHVLKAAFGRSKLTVKDWNELGGEEIAKRIEAELADFAAFVNG